MNALRVFISTAVLFHIFLCVSSLQYNELKQRLKDGLQEYDPDIRPVYNLSEPLEVSLYFYMKTLVEVKENINSIRAVVYVIVTWTDEIFKQNILKSLCVNQECGNESGQYFTLDSKTIWIPDMFLFNSRTKLDLRMETKVIMTYFGKGYWSRYGLFETSCSIESQKYPFDEQECYYELGPGFSNSIHMTMMWPACWN